MVTPIGNEGSEIRRATNGLIQLVLRPVLGDFGYIVEAAHDIDLTGSITSQVGLLRNGKARVGRP